MAASRRPAKPPICHDTVMTLVESGLTHQAVADALGISRGRVSQIALLHGRDSAAIRDERYRQRAIRREAEREAARAARVPKRKGRPVEADVPQWAARAGLTADYRSHSRLYGDIAAARHCRALKRESDPHSLAGVTGRGR